MAILVIIYLQMLDRSYRSLVLLVCQALLHGVRKHRKFRRKFTLPAILDIASLTENQRLAA